MEYTGSKYKGKYDCGRFAKQGTYEYPDGTKYVGQFENGMFNGHGKLILEKGVYIGEWKDGKEVKGDFYFHDGVEYKEANWDYCDAKDRRFRAEQVAGADIKGAGDLEYVNAPPAFRLPLDCYDCGDGYYDPEVRKVFDYEEKDEEGEPVAIRTPDEKEIKWITTKCRVGAL